MYLVATSWRRSSNASCVWVKLNWNRKSTKKKPAHTKIQKKKIADLIIILCIYMYVHSPLGLLASYLFRCSFETADCTSSNVRQPCIDEIPAYLLDAICIRRDNPKLFWNPNEIPNRFHNLILQEFGSRATVMSIKVYSVLNHPIWITALNYCTGICLWFRNKISKLLLCLYLL